MLISRDAVSPCSAAAHPAAFVRGGRVSDTAAAVLTVFSSVTGRDNYDNFVVLGTTRLASQHLDPGHSPRTPARAAAEAVLPRLAEPRHPRARARPCTTPASLITVACRWWEVSSALPVAATPHPSHLSNHAGRPRPEPHSVCRRTPPLHFLPPRTIYTTCHPICTRVTALQHQLLAPPATPRAASGPPPPRPCI